MIWFFGKDKKDKKAEQDADIEEKKPEDVAVKTQAPEALPEPVPQIQPEPEPEVEAEPKKGWIQRLSEGLSKSSSKIATGISDILTKRKLDETVLEELEDVLIMGDLGPVTASSLVQALSDERFGKDISDEEIKEFLAGKIAEILEPVAVPLVIDTNHKPFVILVTGVNGAGKTTTIGKLAKIYKDQGLKVMIGAGDTFRAAAVEQLAVWGARAGVPVIKKDLGADAAALAFEAYEQAKQQGSDVLLIDTAGRLQNKANLMAELEKIVRVLKKHDETAPHSRLIVLDATTGQNAHSQVDVFKEKIDLTGMIVTKLDGSAKGGVLVSLADIYKLPVHAIGVGEKQQDLQAFKAVDYARSLMGLVQKS